MDGEGRIYDGVNSRQTKTKNAKREEEMVKKDEQGRKGGREEVGGSQQRLS